MHHGIVVYYYYCCSFATVGISGHDGWWKLLLNCMRDVYIDLFEAHSNYFMSDFSSYLRCVCVRVWMSVYLCLYAWLKHSVHLLSHSWQCACVFVCVCVSVCRASTSRLLYSTYGSFASVDHSKWNKKKKKLEMVILDPMYKRRRKLFEPYQLTVWVRLLQS